mgnify:CR=1 FL=1
MHKDKEYFLKRIIGASGDTIKIENGIVSMKKSGTDTFKVLDEQYLNESNNGSTFIGGSGEVREFIVPEDSYFVM